MVHKHLNNATVYTRSIKNINRLNYLFFELKMRNDKVHIHPNVKERIILMLLQEE